ncbi:MAG: hypothetical protein WBC70_06055 [Candidatus Aminicenantales bacterium]
MKFYSRDPRWIVARFGQCKKCGAVLAGKDALYFPAGRTILCETCGDPEWQRFLSEAHDEDVYNGSGNPYAS